MIFYDNAFRLRIPHTRVYRIHQQLDYFMQERKGEKLPYSFKILPGEDNDANLFVRSAVSLGLPGEKKRELFLTEGDEISFITSMAIFHKGTQSDGVSRRMYTPADDKLHPLAVEKLIRAGLEPRQLKVSTPELVHIAKGNEKRGFCLPVVTIQGTAVISNQQDAENAIVYGVGPKRVFGCGYIHLAGL